MKALIFDLDGTLVDSRQDLAASANAARAHLGLAPLPVEVVQNYVGEGARKLVQRAIGEDQAGRLEEALEFFFAHYGKNLLVRTALYPGVVAMLESIACPKAVLTNKPGRFARPVSEGLGIARCFEAVWGEGDVPARKPDPRGALSLCEKLGASPAQVMLVGDSKIDAATAREAQMPFVGVTWGFGTEAEMRQQGATRFAHDATELTAILSEPEC